MCNFYSVTKGQQAIRELYRAATDRTGNLPPVPGVFPDYPAPIVCNGPDGRELMMARWGLPSPKFALEGKKVDKGVTNVRNVASPHWRRWLGVENRCLVPFTSFSEHEVLPDGRRPPIWFALSEDRPLACFAGIWVSDWDQRTEIERGGGHSRSVRLPNHGAECRGRDNPPKGNAGDTDDAGGVRCLDVGADRRGVGATTAIAG